MTQEQKYKILGAIKAEINLLDDNTTTKVKESLLNNIELLASNIDREEFDINEGSRITREFIVGDRISLHATAPGERTYIEFRGIKEKYGHGVIVAEFIGGKGFKDWRFS